MPNNKRQWVYTPAKAKKPQVPAAAKELITAQCQQLIDSEFKPRYIDNPVNSFHKITEIYGKWYRNYYYFCSTYHLNLSSDALAKLTEITGESAEQITAQTSENKFTRLEYIGEDKFNLAYMRHTGQWWEVNTGLSLKRTLEELKRNEIFHPH
jgi:hypothetical protein